MGKTIFVLLDACRFDVMTENGGYLEQAIDAKLGAKYRVLGELPSLSRPMYETVVTGLTSAQHGIVGNHVVRPSCCENVFSLCKSKGLVTAAAAYHWHSELHGICPFSHNDRYQLDGTGDIQYGIYYFADNYPDSHLLCDGEFLRKTYHPDFLLLHAMGLDYIGHQHGGNSKEYRETAMCVSDLLSNYIPNWLAEGYHVVVSADHGMDDFGIHGGTLPEQREIPLYIFSKLVTPGRFEKQPIPQLNIAPLLCKLLELPIASGMLSQLQIT